MRDDKCQVYMIYVFDEYYIKIKLVLCEFQWANSPVLEKQGFSNSCSFSGLFRGNGCWFQGKLGAVFRGITKITTPYNWQL